MVALTPGKVQEGSVWDSGRVSSSDSVGIEYNGAPLQPGTRYYWQVRTWDEHGQPVRPSEPSWWETGLLKASSWTAQWISGETTMEREDRAASPKWIWTAGEDALHHAKEGSHHFQLSFELGGQPVEGTLLITAKDTVAAAMNGESVLQAEPTPPWGPSFPWGTFRTADVTSALQRGVNVLSADAEQMTRGPDGSGALIALLRVRFADGHVERFVSDGKWTSNFGSKANADAQPAQVVAQIGEDSLGTPWPPQPATLLRRSVVLSKPVRSARLYVTALGAYQFHINGNLVGREVLAPGWTDYRARLYYQTYDVTAMLHKGENVIGALLGDGWYASGLVSFQQRFNFGRPPLRLMAQLEIEYADGTHDRVISDPGWQASDSAVLRSDLYNGESYDARHEQPGWDGAGFVADKRWRPALRGDAPSAELVGQNFQPIELEQTLKARTVTSPSPGVFLFDMGQNMVGMEKLLVRGPRGTRVRLRFGEVLQPDGQLYAENMRTAEETDTYTLRGGGEETFVPHFTYHGYRYVEVTGYPGKPSLDAVTGLVFHTAAPFTVSFETSNPTIQQLWKNILWGQRGNFESVPTDCPQRDERLGWMGDAQVFWRTASYNMNLASFSEKFGADMRVAQSAQGEFSNITPRVGTVAGEGSPGWADAGVIIPFVAWTQFGDKRILTEAWQSMDRYLGLLSEQNPSFISTTHGYGDWLAIGSTTPQDLIATAYWAYDAQLMAQMAQAINRPRDAERYQQIYEHVRTAFQQRFIRSDGSVGSDSQTSYVLALHTGLVPDALRAVVAQKLVSDIEAHQWHLTTGFLGTPYIMEVLSNTGHSDAAYKLLLQDSFPSWGYMVRHGATTMWERWNGDQMLGDPGMNSFNHYAYGSVGEWLYRYVAGIDLDPQQTGFHHLSLHPQFSRALGQGGATYDSVYGPIRSMWRYANNTVDWSATVPANTTATVSVPAAATAKVLLNGKALDAELPGVTKLSRSGGELRLELSSGTYRFTLPMAETGESLAGVTSGH
jgi:alpha-L-rhamnosidase